jgi:putative ABC transport system permease protein
LTTGCTGPAPTWKPRLSSLLFEIEVLDPFTFSVVPVLLLLVALGACLLPARRATRIEPTVAFRAE